MKRLGKILTMAMTLTLFCAIPALAANTIDQLHPGNDGRTYTLSYTSTSGSTDSGKQFVLLIVKGEAASADNITVDSILYIDQAAADANGTVTFSGFQLKSNSSAQVFIGGGSLSSPANPYYIHVDGVEVSGTVVSEGIKESTVVLKDSGGVEIESAGTTGGTFSFSSVAEGSYKLVCTKSGHLAATKDIIVTGTELAVDAIKLLGGDVNNDGRINGTDLSVLLEAFGQSEVSGGVDINGDNRVNGTDLSILLKNFGTSSK